MQDLDKNCCLIFDEISVSSGLSYEPSKQRISGFEDMGELGRSNKYANHALVFMLRGLTKTWKQVVAYYFVTSTVSSDNLKIILKTVICQIQAIGLNVMATVCDQGTTQREALKELCGENITNPCPYTFTINGRNIAVVFDVPHLLKCTRNALLRCNLLFKKDKIAKFKYIKQVFDIDQTKNYKTLYRLKPADFNFKDSFNKMRVKIAAELSHSVAAAIETYCSLDCLPAEAVYTAELAQLIDDLFDSLNGHTKYPTQGKIYKCALLENSPHLQFWSDLLPELEHWLLIEIKRNPNCHHFTAALKTVVLNNLAAPQRTRANCEPDNCVVLENFRQIIVQK